jgi:L,D-peptidoglycan transpeptidase YkuD (ErfK/YbiS/YcfS/YnhG family)
MMLGTVSVLAVVAGFVVGLLATTELATASPSATSIRSTPSTSTSTSTKTAPERQGASHAQTPSWARRLPPRTTQAVRTVTSHFWCERAWCTVTQAWQRVDGVWTIKRHFRSTIGRNGWGKQREGDLRSPNGVLAIKVTFSTGKQAPGSMPWKRRLPTSVVSAAAGRYYNTWIEQRGRTDGNRPSMRYGLVVDYNRVRLRPFVGPKPLAGKGSGIFYHTSRPGREWAPTEGCTQIGNVDNMRWLVRWLRPAAHPRIVQNR